MKIHGKIRGGKSHFVKITQRRNAMHNKIFAGIAIVAVYALLVCVLVYAPGPIAHFLMGL